MINKFKLIDVREIMDVDNQLVLGVKLEIQDKPYISIAKNILKDDDYYKDGWEVEINLDSKTMKPIGIYELFYIGDDGRIYIENLMSNRYNYNFIASINLFILKYLYEKKKNNKAIKNLKGKVVSCMVGYKATLEIVPEGSSYMITEISTANVKDILMIWDNKICFETNDSIYIVNQN